MTRDTIRSRFRALHAEGSFIMPNPHDLGSCRLLTVLGYQALATTSGGFAASMGRLDMTVSRHELVDHVRSLCDATHLPINVDAEQCFPGSPEVSHGRWSCWPRPARRDVPWRTGTPPPGRSNRSRLPSIV